MEEQTLFEPADTVVLKDAESARPYFNHLGDGPFTVVSVVLVEDILSACSFPNTHCNEDTHNPNCAVSDRMAVGHPQWIVIRGSIDGVDRRFSGAWFVRA